MLSHTVPIDARTDLKVASSRSAAAGISLTVFEDGTGQASLYLPDRERAQMLIAALVDATRHVGWLSESQAAAMVGAMGRRGRPWWRRWLAGK